MDHKIRYDIDVVIKEELAEEYWSLMKEHLNTINWVYFSKNPNITMKIIEDNLELPWDWHGISDNPNITIDFIKRYNPDLFHWYALSLNKAITMDMVEQNLDLPWNWNGISNNNNLDLDFIERHIDKPFDWELISLNKNLTMDFINKYPNKSWYWNWISSNENITLNDIENNSQKPWSWINIAQDQILTLDFIKRHKDIFSEPSNIKSLTFNKNITTDIIDYFADKFKKEHYHYLSLNENIPIEYIFKNKDKDWLIDHISRKFKITEEIIEKYPLKWNWYEISKNEKASFELICKIENENLRRDHPNYRAMWEHYSRFAKMVI